MCESLNFLAQFLLTFGMGRLNTIVKLLLVLLYTFPCENTPGPRHLWPYFARRNHQWLDGTLFPFEEEFSSLISIKSNNHLKSIKQANWFKKANESKLATISD